MISLKKYGIDFEGSVEDAVALPLTAIPPMKMTLYKGTIMWSRGNGRLLSDGTKAGGGGYGDLYLVDVVDAINGRRKKVYEKRPREQQTNLLTEACLQIYARQELAKYELAHTVAEPLDIIRMPRYCSFTMAPFEGVIDLHAALDLVIDIKGPAFDLWFLQLLVQILIVIGLLDTEIGVNHRDLKGDNILISGQSRQRTGTLMVRGRKWSYTYMNEVYIVDFGFSCKGEVTTGNASVSAGPFFGLHDTCPKEGRDIFILFCYFYGRPVFRQLASDRLLGFVRRLLAVPRVLEHLERYGTERTEYLYLLLNNREFNSKHCSAWTVLAEIASQWPAILEVSAA